MLIIMLFLLQHKESIVQVRLVVAVRDSHLLLMEKFGSRHTANIAATIEVVTDKNSQCVVGGHRDGSWEATTMSTAF